MVLVKKYGISALLLFGVYILVMYVYIFHSNSGGIPESLQGTVADPHTFMSEQEVYLSEEYSKIKNFLFFVATPFEWLVYIFILVSGLSQAFENSLLIKVQMGNY